MTYCQPVLLAGVPENPERRRTRAGVHRVHESAVADHRVLLVDARRDGSAPWTERAILRDLGRAGRRVDLDAVRDPRSILRVLKRHPNALDAYDVVVAIAPRGGDWRGSGRVLGQLLERVSPDTTTLLVACRPRGADDSTSAGGDARSRVHTLLLPPDAEPTSTDRQISAALHVLLDQSDEHGPRADPMPASASLLRADIGPRAIERLERITHLARESFGLAAAEVNLVQGDHVVTVASAGAQPRLLPIDDSLCTIALRNSGITVMADTWLDPDACRRKPTHDPGAVRFYAGCPIRSSTGEPIGVLCIWDLSPQNVAELDTALLHDLALLSEGELIHA